MRFLETNRHSVRGDVLDIGCGSSPYKPLFEQTGRVSKYVGVDLADATYGRRPDLIWDGARLPVDDATFDTAILTEVLEHVQSPSLVLHEAARVLKPEGSVVITTPFLWPLHEVPYDQRRLTPFSLQHLLQDAGFDEIEISATGGWHASLATMIGLWWRRAPLGRFGRASVTPLAMPLIGLLEAIDKPPASFAESTMMPGIAATAHRPGART